VLFLIFYRSDELTLYYLPAVSHSDAVSEVMNNNIIALNGQVALLNGQVASLLAAVGGGGIGGLQATRNIAARNNNALAFFQVQIYWIYYLLISSLFALTIIGSMFETIGNAA
jgi:hypothetical protein